MKKLYHRWVTVSCLSASAISLYIATQYQSANQGFTGQLSVLALILVLSTIPLTFKVIRKKI